MARFYRRRFYRRSGTKKNYQIMRPWWTITQTQNGYVTVLSPETITGVRKVKNFSIEFSSPSEAIVRWALVYVPSGYNPNNLSTNFGETVYTPTNNVIMAGLYDASDPGNTARRSTRLSRLLRSGDGIALVYSSQNDPPNFRFLLTYAITF